MESVIDKKVSLEKILILVIAVILICLNFNPINFVKKYLIKQESGNNFILQNSLNCKIEKSNDREEIGETIGLINKNTNKPLFLSNNGGSQEWNKISETDDMLIMGIVATSGGTDTITLNKLTGKFEREEKANPQSGVYLSNYSSGQCK